jgi:S-adenosylmethionine-dependent methyltransferase
MSAINGERFQSDAAKYAAYLETPEGRLRSDLTFANLQDFLPPRAVGSLCALDLGCGTAEAGIRLARLGMEVTLLDSSPAMLDVADRAAREAGVADKVALHYADAVQVANLFGVRSFDVVLCHNLLEYVDDPVVVLRSAACALRNSSSILSILVRNQAGEVLKAAIRAGDVAAAEANLNAEWGHESLYGGRVRLFTTDSLRTVLTDASLATVAERGVRVLSDYLPAVISRSANYDVIYELERKLGGRREFSAVARYAHCLACRVDSKAENEV